MSHKTCIFFHVPRTGGTSVVASVAKMLGGRNYFGFVDTDPRRLERRLKKILSTERPLAFVHAHISPAAIATDDRLQRAVMLRDPAQRLLSHFRYTFNNRHQSPKYVEFFRRHGEFDLSYFGALEFSRWISAFHQDNFQTRILSGNYLSPVSNDDLTKAIRSLECMDAVGVTNQLGMFLQRLGVPDEYTPSLNKSPSDSKADMPSLSDKDWGKIIEVNLELDLRVFEAATRIALKPNEPPAIALSQIQTSPVLAVGVPGWVQRARHKSAREVILGTARPLLRSLRKVRESSRIQMSSLSAERF